MAHDLAVLAGARLRLVGIDDEVGGAGIALGHERPFEAGREPGATPPAQARGLDLVDHPVVTLVDQRLGLIPGATLASAGELPILETIEIAKDAISVVESHGRP